MAASEPTSPENPPTDASVSAPADPTAQAIDQAAKTVQDIAGDIASTGAPAADLVDLPPGLPAAAADASVAQPDASAPPVEPELSPAPPLPLSRELRRLLAIEVPIIVQLGMRRMTVAEVTRFSVGAIIEFSKSAEEELEMLANNQAIGKGQAVKVGENFGIKLSSIGSVKETIQKLGVT